MYALCARIILTVEHTRDITVSRRGMLTVGHVQKVWAVWTVRVVWAVVDVVARPVAWQGWSAFLKTAMHFLCLTSRSSFYLYSSIRTSGGGGCVWTLCHSFCFRVSLLPHSSQFSPFWCRNNEITCAATALDTINTSCEQNLLIAFLNGTDVCAQTTPLIAFLKCDKLHSWNVTEVKATPHQLRTRTARLVASR